MKREEFLQGVTNNDLNHRILLWEALELTKLNGPSYGEEVVEFGSGHGSTPFLRKYCSTPPRKFSSFDNNEQWARATGASLILNNDWDSINILECGVLFIDHAPGERRQFDLVKYKDTAKIIVIHDSEPTGAGDYKVRQHFNKFKYCVEVKTDGAWVTMLSNFVDLSGCVGKTWGEFKISNYTT